MRWLFVLLLALNLVYIAWQVLAPTTELHVNTAPVKNVRSLVLLSESVPPDASPVPQNITVSTIAAEHSNDEVDNEVSVKDSVNNDLAFGPSVTVDEKKDAPIREQRLQADSCFSLGPFRDLDTLRNLTRELKPYVKTTYFRGKEVKKRSLYWVYIRPAKNRVTAVATSKRLKAKKVKDFYLIREGDKNNGISLGYFRSQSGAKRLLSDVKKLGFDVVMEPVYKSYTIYWLDYQLAHDFTLPESIIAKYIKLEKKEKVGQSARDCFS
ncbi:MAG: hypothetical protein COB77_06285 [Gammaproteobacteria bacterium]|nr:MAG: hypothetical protein COB77_06285 [Gammaproteobacteria bacterium]